MWQAEQYMTEVKVGIEELTGAIDQLEESRLVSILRDVIFFFFLLTYLLTF